VGVFAGLMAFAASAADGRIEINQAAALAGGVTLGDAAGFPVTISQAGSYVLTSDLVLPNQNVDGIQIAAWQVDLDLGGYGIFGANIRVPGGGCNAGGSGRGVAAIASSDGVRVRNGRVRGMGDAGIDLAISNAAQVHDVAVDQNCGAGLRTGFIAIVSRVQARLNMTDGVWVDNGSVVRESVAQYNGFDGFETGQDSIFTDCISAVNGGRGFASSGPILVDNAISVSNGQRGFWLQGTGGLVLDSIARLNGQQGITNGTAPGIVGAISRAVSESNAVGGSYSGTVACNLIDNTLVCP
jgi:hypothetical protein